MGEWMYKIHLYSIYYYPFWDITRINIVIVTKLLVIWSSLEAAWKRSGGMEQKKNEENEETKKKNYIYIVVL